MFKILNNDAQAEELTMLKTFAAQTDTKIMHINLPIKIPSFSHYFEVADHIVWSVISVKF